MSVNEWVNHFPMSWLSEKGENETQFRFPFIISMLAHSSECVRREMRNEFKECPLMKKEMSKEFFEKNLKSFKIGSLVHTCIISTFALYT